MKIITLIIAAIGAFLFPIQGLLVAVGCAILLDTGTGIFKAVKISGWRSVKSRRMSDFAGKIILYCTAIIVVYVVDYNLIGEFCKHWFSVENVFTKVVSVLLVVVELTSVKENFEEAYDKDLWLLLKKLFQRGKELKNDINELTN